MSQENDVSILTVFQPIWHYFVTVSSIKPGIHTPDKAVPLGISPAHAPADGGVRGVVQL